MFIHADRTIYPACIQIEPYTVVGPPQVHSNSVQTLWVHRIFTMIAVHTAVLRGRRSGLFVRNSNIPRKKKNKKKQQNKTLLKSYLVAMQSWYSHLSHNFWDSSSAGSGVIFKYLFISEWRIEEILYSEFGQCFKHEVWTNSISSIAKQCAEVVDQSKSKITSQEYNEFDIWCPSDNA